MSWVAFTQPLGRVNGLPQGPPALDAGTDISGGLEGTSTPPLCHSLPQSDIVGTIRIDRLI
jgi:hypothetical protein